MSKTKLSKNTLVKSLDELEKSGFIKRLGNSINRSYQYKRTHGEERKKRKVELK